MQINKSEIKMWKIIKIEKSTNVSASEQSVSLSVNRLKRFTIHSTFQMKFT